MKLLISGCYGTGNVGDEAILESLVKLARKKYTNETIITSSIAPEKTKQLHSVDEVISTLDRNPIQWVKSASEVDLILLGGGSLLGDDFIYRHSIIASIAQLLNIPVGYAAVGVTFCNNESLRVNCIENMDFITVRDSGTAEYISQYISKDRIHEVADPAFYKGDDQEETNK
jgi:polysaccharide pyruvyl transferase WcaK-like protein